MLAHLLTIPKLIDKPLRKPSINTKVQTLVIHHPRREAHTRLKPIGSLEMTSKSLATERKVGDKVVRLPFGWSLTVAGCRLVLKGGKRCFPHYLNDLETNEGTGKSDRSVVQHSLNL
jgi:hypothetical protein